MCFVTAFDASKRCLAFAIASVDVTAVRTFPRCVSRIDFNQFTAGSGELIRKEGLELIPTMLQDRTIKPGFLCDARARLFDRPARRCRHVARLQRLDVDRSVVRGNRGRRNVVPVLADARRFGLARSGMSAGLGVSLRPALAPIGSLLRLAMLSIEDAQPLDWDRCKFAGRESDAVGDATINPNFGSKPERRIRFELTCKADVPAERRETDGRVFDDAAHRASIAKTNPPDLRQADARPIAVQSIDIDLAALEAEGLILALAARRRVAGAAGEEVLKRLVEIAQGLLFAGLRNGGDPIELGAELRQLAGLRDIIEVLSGLALELPPEMLALIECRIVDRAADARELPEQGFLFGTRGELEAETAEDYQGAGRYSVSAERRSRTRGALARSAGSPFVSSRSRKIKAALTRPAIPPRHECRGFSRRIR